MADSTAVPLLSQRKPSQSKSAGLSTHCLPTMSRLSLENEKRLSWQAVATARPTQTNGSSDEYSLSDASYSSLLKKKKERLEELCAERDLLVVGEHGFSKREMILLLLRWRDMANPSLSQDDALKTYVGGRKTSPRPKTPIPQHPPVTPLLADPAFLLQDRTLLSSDRPEPKDPYSPSPTRTPPNPDDSLPEAVLDLDALNIDATQRISKDKLKKGEKIGSGGFKDVYKGKYGRFRVAIADLRAAHLTKADVQELGLLRDFNRE